MQTLYGGGNAPTHFRDVPEPVIHSAVQAIVRPIAVAVCDLDIAYLMGLLPTEPYAFGHEFTAEVIAVGDAVTSVQPGDVVTVPFQISCGSCTRCRSSRSLDCTTVPPLSTYGLEPFGGGDVWGGACAEYVLVPFADAMCLRLRAGIDPLHAASVSDNVVDGYRSVVPYVQPHDEALVIGSASVGLYAVATARAIGTKVTYVDHDPARLACAEHYGATVIEAVPNGNAYGEFPVTAACVSTPDGLISAFRSTQPGGICHSSGIQFFGVANADYLELYRRGIKFFTGRANARDDMPAVLDLMYQGRLDLARVTGNIIAFSEAAGTLENNLTHKTIIDMRK
jgi:threonine dehydrogenase-like Zn-dependent dehydrogenase